MEEGHIITHKYVLKSGVKTETSNLFKPWDHWYIIPHHILRDKNSS